ncbi:MAG: serine hydrolase [Planctomycetes bacterium]|nr:serine hydrolase [Planctomycetota bacterium]
MIAKTSRPLAAAALCLLLSGLGRAQDPVFPGATWPTATPASQGLDGSVLDAGVRALPFPLNYGPLVVIANGHLVYAIDYPANAGIGGIDTPKPLFSCSKLVTGMVAASLIQQGTLAGLDALIPNTVPGAWGSRYPGDSSVRMFLAMTSDYGLSPYHPSGGQYAYNNNGVDFLGEHLARTRLGLGPDQMHQAVLRTLYATIGHQDPVQFVGQWGGWDGGLHTSARDAARLGYLLLRNGTWHGQRVLDPEFVDGLFRCQIPSSARRYQSSTPNENSQFNQQHVTDQLGGNWSFGMWKVGAARADGTFEIAAAEGFRGKRIVLMPHGSLPDPLLEVVLVTLPSPSNEGPSTTVYADLVRRAVRTPPSHPEEDPAAVIAAFDDGHLLPLRAQLGAPFVRDGQLVVDGEERLVHAATVLGSGHALIRTSTGLPRGGWLGVIGRARSVADDFGTPNGPQFLVRVRRSPQGSALRAEVVAPSIGLTDAAPFTGQWLTVADGSQPVTILTSFVGDRVTCSVDGHDLLGTNGFRGVPTPSGGGYVSLRGSASVDETVEVDYFLLRRDGGAIAQVAVNKRGEHYVAMFGPQSVATWQASSFYFEIDHVRFDSRTFGAALPFLWPKRWGLDEDHFLVSSHNAMVQLPQTSISLLVDYQGRRDGVALR